MGPTTPIPSDLRDLRVVPVVDLLAFVLYSLGLLLNGVTLVAILGSQNLRKIPHIFTFNVALADFASSVLAVVLPRLPAELVSLVILEGIWMKQKY